MNNFEKTMLDSEISAKRRLADQQAKAERDQVYTSVTHAEISLGKLVDAMSEEFIKENKQHIDNVYYHLGAMKGCVS